MTTTLTPTLPSNPTASASRSDTAAAAPGPTHYQTLIIRTLGDFEVLRKSWDDFMRDADVQNLCLTHAWLTNWLLHFPPSELLVIIVQDAQGRWMGAAPFKISTSPTGLSHKLLRHLQFIGTNPTVYDWMQVVTHPDADENAVLKAVAEAMQKSRWDVLDLQFFKQQKQLDTLCRLLKGKPDRDIRESMAIPYLPLPDTVEEYEKSRRKKTRLEVNRHNNRFAKEFGHPPALEFQPAGEACDAVLTRFFAGHIKYWAERGQKSDFSRYPKLFDFYKDMLAHAETVSDPQEPKLLFSVLMLDEQQLSYHLGFWQGRSYLSHLTNFNQGFKNYSPGTIHMDALVFDALDRQATEFEFGRGDEAYKKMWTQTKKPLWNLRCFRNAPSAWLWQVDIQLKKLLGKAVDA